MPQDGDRKRFHSRIPTPRLTLLAIALILVAIAAVTLGPKWLELKPATGSAAAMAAAGDLDRR